MPFYQELLKQFDNSKTTKIKLMSTNSIADMCTRIRNAGMRKRSEVQLGPQSKFNRNVLNALVREG